MRVFEAKSAQKPRFCARNARKRGFRKAKAHKNPIFVLGDGCRELSSAATSPAGCIWQQYARQQIAATYHATCPVHAAGHTTVSKQPGYLLPLIPPWRYRLGATAKKLPPAHLSPYNLPPCMLPQPAAKTYLPLILPCIPRTTYLPGILPRDGSRAQRAGDSDVGANDKGAGDDPGDWVDAH